jgi:hypothetical protein
MPRSASSDSCRLSSAATMPLPPVSREIVTGCLASLDALAVTTGRPGAEVRARAKADPRVKVLTAHPHKSTGQTAMPS